jgi:hypothetical protein
MYDPPEDATRGDVMRHMIDLPDELDARVKEYLERHPSMTLASLIERGLNEDISVPDLGPLLELSGFVSVDVDEHDDRPIEDRAIDRER